MCDDSANLTVRQKGSPKSALPELDLSSIKFPNAVQILNAFSHSNARKPPLMPTDRQHRMPHHQPAIFRSSSSWSFGGTSIILVD